MCLVSWFSFSSIRLLLKVPDLGWSEECQGTGFDLSDYLDCMYIYISDGMVDIKLIGNHSFVHIRDHLLASLTK